MSAHRRHRIDREAAERLLGAHERGSPRHPVRGVPAPDHDPLVDLLAAAAATSPTDPVGEEAVVAAFRMARSSYTASDYTAPVLKAARPVRRSVLSRLLTVQAAAVVGAAAAGGLALAAGTGVLPTPLHPDSPPAPTAMIHQPTTAQSSAVPMGTATTAPTSRLFGLCHAFDAHVGAERGKALDTAAFTELVVAAGGKDKVEGYCVDLLAAEHSSARPTSHAPSTHANHKPLR